MQASRAGFITKRASKESPSVTSSLPSIPLNINNNGVSSKRGSTPTTGRRKSVGKNANTISASNIISESIVGNEDEKLFLSNIKFDLQLLQKKINDIKTNGTQDFQRVDDVNISNFIFPQNSDKTRYKCLEFFIEKLVEFQQLLLISTDRLIPVTKRFKAQSTYSNNLNSKLTKFLEVGDRVFDIVEQRKDSAALNTEEPIPPFDFSEIEMMKDELLLIQKENENMAKQIEKTNIEKENLRLINEQQREEIRKLKKQYQECEIDKAEKVSSLETKIVKLETNNIELAKDNLNIKQENIDLKKKLQDNLKLFKSQTEEANTIEKLKVKVKELEKINLNLQTNLNDITQRAHLLERSDLEKKQEIEKLFKEKLLLESSIEEIKKLQHEETKSLESLTAIKLYLDKLETSHNQVVDDNSALKDKIKNLEKVYNQALEDIKQLEDKLKLLQNESNKVDVKKLQNKLELAEKIAIQKEVQYEELVKEYQILSIELTVSEKKLESYKQQLTMLQNEKQKAPKEDEHSHVNLEVSKEIIFLRKELEEKLLLANEKMKEIQMAHIHQLKALNDTFSQERKLMLKKVEKFQQRCELLEKRLQDVGIM